MQLISKLHILAVPSILRRAPLLGSRTMSEHRVFPLEPTRWQWTKFKDLVHYYVLLGVIPCGLFVAGMNLFQGPATLTKIPEDYVPKYWEYYKSPVTRFIARYLTDNPQQDYEKMMCYVFAEQHMIRLRQLEKTIKQKLAVDQDYKAYYYKPVPIKYYKVTKEESDKVLDLQETIPKH